MEYTKHFDSVSDVLSYCEDKPKRKIGRAKFLGRSLQNWNVVSSAVNGLWQEGLNEVQGMLHIIEQELFDLKPPTDLRRRRRFSEDSGDEVDNDRLRDGQSDYWIETRRTSTNAPKRITIVTDMCANGDVKHHDILWRGATAIVATDILERNGYQVELIAGNRAFGSYENWDDMLITFTLKRAGESLDISNLINCLSGWFFRSVIFQTIYSRSDVRATDGLGAHRRLDKECMSDVCGNANIVIVDNVWSLRDAIAKVREIVLAASETDQD